MVKIKGYSDRSNYLGITFSCSMFLNNMKHQTTPSEPQFGRNGKIQYSLGQLLDSPQYLCCICCIPTQYRRETGTSSKWKLQRTEPESSDCKSRALQECPGMLSNAQDTRHKQQVQAAAFTAGNVWVPVVGLPTSHRTLQSNSKGHQTLLPEPL